MARPTKTGLEYFPMDVDTDDKFELIEAKHELIGFAIIIKLYQRIYKSGYFLDWSEERLLIFKKSVNVDINTINVVINDCLRYDIFDKILFEKYNILTSSGIQKRFLAACDRRKIIDLVKEYIIVDINPIIARINWQNVTFSTQRKEEERKEEIKGEESEFPPQIQRRFLLEIEEVEEYLLSEIEWKTTRIATPLNLNIEKVDFLIKEFSETLKGRGEEQKTPADAKSHFYNWIKNKPNGTHLKSNPPSEEEFLTAIANGVVNAMQS